jgi:hypothetical protein
MWKPASPDLIDNAKQAVDTAAHARYHITLKQDMHDFRTAHRK